MKTSRSIPILLLFLFPLVIRACGQQNHPTPIQTPEKGTVEAGATEPGVATKDAFDMTALAEIDTAEAVATNSAPATEEALRETESVEYATAGPILTRIAAQITRAATLATPTDIFAIGATPEAAALDTLKAWATVPYQNEQAVALSKNDQQAWVKVSAEFKDSGTGAWVRKEAVIQCGSRGPIWKCVPSFNFVLPATATPAP